MARKAFITALLAALGICAPASAGVTLPSTSVDQAKLLTRQVLTVHVTGKRGTSASVYTVPRSLARTRIVRFGASGRRRAFLRLTRTGLKTLASCSARRISVAARSRRGTARASRALRLAGYCASLPTDLAGPPSPTLGAPETSGAARPAAATPSESGATSPSGDPTPAPSNPGTSPTPTPTAAPGVGVPVPSLPLEGEPTPAPGSIQLPGSPRPAIVFVPGCDWLDQSACMLPFPNDHFTAPDPDTPTGRRLQFVLDEMPRNIEGKPIDTTEYNRNDGFSPGTPIITRVPGLDNQAAFEETGLVGQTDMERTYDPDQPVVVLDADTGERALIWAELDSTAPTDAERVLIIRPGKNLTEGHRYIVALRNLKNADGEPIPPQPPFKIYRDGYETLQPLVENRRPHMEDLFDRLAADGIERKDLYLAWDFTIASEYDRTERARHIRDEAFAELGDTDLADLEIPAGSKSPAFTVDKVTPRPDDDRTAYEIDGTFQVPCFLSTPDCSPGGRFVYAKLDDTIPVRVPGSTMTAKFRCIVPDAAVAPDAAPARPSLYGHGLLGSRFEVNQGQARDMTNEHNMIYCATDWSGMSSDGEVVLPDGTAIPTLGDIPSVAAILTDVSNFPLLADRVQQGMLNFMFLGRLLVHPDGLASDPAFKVEERSMIDTSRLYYDGNSQGGIIGGALMALIPDATRGVLGVPGMNYSTLLNRSTDFEGTPGETCPPTAEEIVQVITEEWTQNPPDPTDPEGVLEALNFSYSCPLYASYPNHLDRQLLFALMQQLWDRAEANGYAHHMTSDPVANTPAHEILLHGGLGDHQVAQVSAEVEARTIGAHMRPLAVDPGRSFDVDPFFAIPKITQYPFAGSALEIWDTGPLRDGGVGTPVAPAANIPNRVGQDPHEYPRRTPAARAQKSAFFQPEGLVIDTCSGLPCHAVTR